MGQSRKRSLSNKEKEKGKSKGKGSRRSNERDVQIQTDDLAPQGQSPASRSNESTSTQSSENSGSSFFEHIGDSAITGGTFQQTNGHSNSVTIELNVNHYPPTQDSNTSQSATISQPSPPLQPSSSQNVLTGLSSSPVDARQCTSPSSDLPQQKTNYDIYKEQLELQRRGIPLWIPESNGCLPMIYQRTGVTIGDIGIVTPSGAFSFVFNICLPRDHPSQPDDLPEDFEPMNLRPRDIRKFPEFKSGSHLASKAIHKVANDGRSTDLVFESNASEGAILTLPDGFVAHDLENLPQIQAYAAANIESWYRYINGTCGRQAKNGEIRLVIGCDKTTSWGMAVIDSPEQPTHHQLRFRPVESGTPSTSSSSPIPLHTWDYAGFVDAKVGPYPEDIALLREDDDSAAATTGKYSNQCLFIRTLNLTLRDDIFASINDELALALTEGWSSFTSTSYSSTNSSSSSINELHSGGAHQAARGTNFGTQRGFYANIGDERVTITTSPTAKKSHPSDALNRMIIDKAPGCRVAITRDQHWCSVITEDDESMPSNVQIAERVLKSYDIVEDNGVAFLEHKKQNVLSTSTSSQPLSSDVHLSELKTSHPSYGVAEMNDVVSEDDLEFHQRCFSGLRNVKEELSSSFLCRDHPSGLGSSISRENEDQRRATPMRTGAILPTFSDDAFLIDLYNTLLPPFNDSHYTPLNPSIEVQRYLRCFVLKHLRRFDLEQRRVLEFVEPTFPNGHLRRCKSMPTIRSRNLNKWAHLPQEQIESFIHMHPSPPPLPLEPDKDRDRQRSLQSIHDRRMLDDEPTSEVLIEKRSIRDQDHIRDAEDTSQIARLARMFAMETTPFTLSEGEALRESQNLCDKRQVLSTDRRSGYPKDGAPFTRNTDVKSIITGQQEFSETLAGHIFATPEAQDSCSRNSYIVSECTRDTDHDRANVSDQYPSGGLACLSTENQLTAQQDLISPHQGFTDHHFCQLHLPTDCETLSFPPTRRPLFNYLIAPPTTHPIPEWPLFNAESFPLSIRPSEPRIISSPLQASLQRRRQLNPPYSGPSQEPTDIRPEGSNHDREPSKRCGVARPSMTMDGSESYIESSDGTTRIPSDQQCHIAENLNHAWTQNCSCRINEESILPSFARSILR